MGPGFGRLALFALVWNGVGIFLWVRQLAILMEWRWEWLPTLFLLPYSAVGIWATAHFVRSFLRLVAVGPTIVELDRHPLHGGDRVRFALIQGGHFRLTRLTVEVVCEEQASFHQGTHVRTECQVVHCQPLFEERDVKVKADAPLEREGEIEIPVGAMHSFRSRSPCRAVFVSCLGRAAKLARLASHVSVVGLSRTPASRRFSP